MRCRHRKSWIIVGGHAEWCYECGAWRQLRPVDGENAVVPISGWVRPTGPGGKNPYDAKAFAPRKAKQCGCGGLGCVDCKGYVSFGNAGEMR